MSDKLEEYRRKVVGTNIDQWSLLSTDYFNTFNSVVMVLGMLPDAPELLQEIEEWKFYDYVEHYRASGLDFAELAIEAYPYAPTELREAFERKINGMRVFVEGCAYMLRRLCDAGEMSAFASFSVMAVELIHSMIQEGNGIVHGAHATLNQSDIDNLF